MRRAIWMGVLVGAIIVSLVIAAQGCAAKDLSKAKSRATAKAVKQALENKGKTVQLVTFPDTGWEPVKVVRGKSTASAKNARKRDGEKAETAEIVTFGDPRTRPVRVVRGETDRGMATSGQPHRANAIPMQVVTFADPRDRPVSILRGSASRGPDIELFGPASVADLDRVAFAVDGAESSHGLDLRMWRPEFGGPQGPMQVTAAAAIDVGGGDRFELAGNRALGRAYLASMYRRYGNWSDAIAAYNWGPGNLDGWIGVGRPGNKLPLEVERYRDRVLRDAVLAEPGGVLRSDWPFRVSAPRAGASEGRTAAKAGSTRHQSPTRSNSGPIGAKASDAPRH